MKPAISIRDLTVKYGRFAALENCAIDIYENEIFGILGPNGAGKSSLMKVITGQVEPFSGSAKIWGTDLASNRSELKRIIGLVPQEYSFAHDFTVEQNIRYLAMLYGFGGEDLSRKTDSQLTRYLLKGFASKRSGDLSGGYKRLLNFALSTLHSPKLLLLDEPTVGLDPDIRSQVWAIVKELKSLGNTIVLTTHYLEEAQFLCDRLAIIFKGRILVIGTPAELIRRHGGETKIYLVLDGKAEWFLSQARRIKGIRAVDAASDLLTITCNNLDVVGVISAIGGVLEGAKVRIKDTLVKEPTLDDVFKNIVGAELGVK
ncbi:MAG: ABC transporter ATP-binding protein [Candidatus Micrarchaeota archaeon]